MKYKEWILIGCLIISVKTIAQKEKQEFKIVGYYSINAAANADVSAVPFKELSHINLYFLNPDKDGHFENDLSQLVPFIQAAHQHHVKVLASIGGGVNHPYYHDLLKEHNRDKLADTLLQIALRYDLDGIDIDLEDEDIDKNYESFVTGLAQAFKAHHKLVTAAVAVFYKDGYSDKALAQFDFMNVMSYDHTGPWEPSKPGPHSTYKQAVEDLDYFHTVRKIDKDKLVLGVGFYGYGFGPLITSMPIDMNYKDIVATFPGAEDSDKIAMPGGATMYYNGIPTIKKKVLLAKKMASGIMIWQVMGDAEGNKSLLKVINESKKAK